MNIFGQFCNVSAPAQSYIQKEAVAMKKLFAVILIILITLTACSQGAGDTPTVSKKPEEKDPVKPVTSSIFGRNVKYNSYIPAENLTLPIPSGEILNAVQIEKRLYLLGDGAVHSLDIETGESAKLFDTSAAVLASNGGRLYTYSAGTATISEYDPLGSLTNETAIEVGDADSVDELWVTDDYYVFKCSIKGEGFIDTNLFIYSRNTCELTISKKMPRTGIELFPYKGNKLLSVTVDSMSGFNLGVFEVETCKSVNLQRINTLYKPTAAYSPKTDTVVVWNVPSTNTRPGYEDIAADPPYCLTEYSLEDTDSIVLNRYYIDVSYDARFYMNVYENVISIISTAEDKCFAYDYLSPPESITILGYDTVQNIVYGFERETGILVKNAYTDYEKLVLKLMAGDTDFDIFNTGGVVQNYVDSEVYVDLKQIESLNSRISGNNAADFAASYNGKYFGVPTYISNLNSEEYYPENGTQFSYSLVVSENNYYAKYIDVAEKIYSDPDGEELYKLFKFISDNPTGNKKKMPFGDDITILASNVYLLSPNSQNRDNAVKFLEYLFDVFNGDIPGIIPESDCYPRLESTENCYAEWRCRPTEIINPIFKARNTIHNQKEGLSKSELKKLARETAAEVAMRIGE